MADEATTQNQGEAAPQPESPAAPAPKSFSLLASERFGNNYVGDVPEAAPEPVEELPEQELPEQEAEEDAEALQQDETETEAETEEAVVSSLAELMETEGYDPEWFQNLRVPVKVDGKESEVPFSEVLKSYQMSEAAEKRLTEAKESQKQAKDAIAAKTQELQGQYAVAARLIQSAEGLLDADIKAVNWDELRRDDPAEYSAKRAELGDRRAQIEAMKREAVQSYQQTTYQQANETAQEAQDRLVAEQSQLLEKLPEWREPEKAEQGKRKLVTYLTGQGFDPDDVANAQDHRLIVMAHKAMQFDEMQGKTNAAMKKVAKIPKVLKPGAPKAPEAARSDKLQRAKARMQKTGSIEDAHRYQQLKRGKA